MTTYLADIKQQYADHEGGLGMVDVVLGSLMRQLGYRAPSSARSAIPSPSTRPLDERSLLDAGQRRPPRGARSSVSISMRVGTGPIWRPALTTERRADAVDPAPVGHERRLVDVPAQHEAGLVLLDPATSSSSP